MAAVARLAAESLQRLDARLARVASSAQTELGRKGSLAGALGLAPVAPRHHGGENVHIEHCDLKSHGWKQYELETEFKVCQRLSNSKAIKF